MSFLCLGDVIFTVAFSLVFIKGKGVDGMLYEHRRKAVTEPRLKVAASATDFRFASQPMLPEIPAAPPPRS